MTARLVIRQLARLQQLDEMRPRNTKQVGCPLRCQLLVLRDQNDRAPQLHVPHDVLEQTENSVRQFQFLAAGADQRGRATLEHPVQLPDLRPLGFGQCDWLVQHGLFSQLQAITYPQHIRNIRIRTPEADQWATGPPASPETASGRAGPEGEYGPAYLYTDSRAGCIMALGQATQ